MKQIALLLLLCTQLWATPTVRTNNDTITLKWEVPEIEIVPSDRKIENDFTVELQCKDALFPQQEGVPAVPYFSTSLILPHGKKVTELHFTALSTKEVKLSSPVTYVEAQYRSDQRPRKTIIDTTAYTLIKPIPSAAVVSTQKSHGVQIVSIASTPILYEGAQNRLTIHDRYEVKLILTNSTVRSTQSAFPSRLTGKNLYLNSEALQSYPETNNRSEQYDWLLISDIFNATSQTTGKLIEHRQSQGIRCKAVDIATIGTTANEIRTFIRNEYLTHGISQVLLAGDETLIPPFRINTFHGISFKFDTITTDLPYQCLDDEDWEAVYKKSPRRGDYIAEIQIGRILCSDMHEFKNQVEKIITYETLDSMDQSLGTMLGVSEKMDDNLWGKSFIESLFVHIPQTVKKEYLCSEDSIWSRDDLVDIINSNRFTVISHAGHANAGLLMQQFQATAMKNSVPLFVKSIGCKAAMYDISSETICERFTLGINGFFAANLNTNVGWFSSKGGGSSQTVQEHFWRAHFEKGIQTFSGMTEYSHRICMEAKSWEQFYLWDMLCSNYFGDPATVYRSPKGSIDILKQSITKPSKGKVSVSLRENNLYYSLPHAEIHHLKLISPSGRVLLNQTNRIAKVNHVLNTASLQIGNGIYILLLKTESALYATPILYK